MTTRRVLPASLALAIGALFCGVSDAALVSYAFTSDATHTTQTGAGVLGDPTDDWMVEVVDVDANGNTEAGIPLVDVDGAATPATLTWFGLRQHNSTNSPAILSRPAPLQGSVYMRHAVEQTSLVIDGILPGTTADIVMFGTPHFNGGDRGNAFTINGETKITATNVSRGSLNEGGNYVVFEDVPVDGSGSITIFIDGAVDVPNPGNSGNFSDFNGFQIDFTPVPEPTSLALIGLGSVAVVTTRRRRV